MELLTRETAKIRSDRTARKDAPSVLLIAQAEALEWAASLLRKHEYDHPMSIAERFAREFPMDVSAGILEAEAARLRKEAG